MKTNLIAPKRNLLQALLILLYLIFPILAINGVPFFRIDLLQRTLFMAGMPIRIDQFYLVLIATLLFVIFFLILTVFLGRGWCGWLCPQTVVNDFAEATAKKLRVILHKSLYWLAMPIAAIPISLLFAFATLLWFMSLQTLVASLISFSEYPIVIGSFFIITIIIYLDLLVVKRSFCKHFCPYGRFQVALQDSTTLNLTFVEETRHACIRCGSCVRSCPMDIDIRDGFQIECINCGRCIDACRNVMANRSYPKGLIAYNFGSLVGRKIHFSSKIVVLLLLAIILTVGLILGVSGKSETAFTVVRNPLIENKNLPDGFQIQGWKAIIGNRGEFATYFTIQAVSVGDVTLLGPVTDLLIQANENRTVSFFIRFNPVKLSGKSIELRILRGKQVVSTVVLKL